MIVVDTNVIAYVLLPGDQTAAARKTLSRDAAWAAPMLWRSELQSVLARYLRQRHSTLAEALEVQSAAESLMAGREFAIDSSAVLELAAASGCSAYDCEFVSLARALGVACISSDRQLVKSFPDTVVALSKFAERAG